MSKLVAWRITRIRGNRADRLGVVQAPDAERAIKIAIREFRITDPEDRKRGRGDARRMKKSGIFEARDPAPA